MTGPAFNRYLIGQPARIKGEFRTQAGVLVDPSTVFFRVRKSNGALTSYQYTVHPEVIRDGTGLYHVEVITDHPGTWHYRVEATGTNAAANEHAFVVTASKVQ